MQFIIPAYCQNICQYL